MPLPLLILIISISLCLYSITRIWVVGLCNEGGSLGYVFPPRKSPRKIHELEHHPEDEQGSTNRYSRDDAGDHPLHDVLPVQVASPAHVHGGSNIPRSDPACLVFRGRVWYNDGAAEECKG